ncbi:MAG: thiamine pyrophosphate-binding protein, partial [Gammaproteobacteria bacterium]
MKAGEALVKLLLAYGVDTVFGIPGTHSLELYRGLANSKLTHVSPRHEQGGGFMADGYARISGKPGVCFVITGPGVTNIATPLGEAYMDSVPMLLISPVNTPDAGGENIGRLHEIADQSAVTAPLTAFSATAQTADDIPFLLARAFAVFASARPQPVHINIPLPVLHQKIGTEWAAVATPMRPAASSESLEACAQLIARAQRPVIVAGGGARGVADGVTGLAERIAAPVITTVAGRGVIPPAHALYPGAQLRADAVQTLLQESDLAILLGTELSQTDHYNDHLQLPAKQIRINLNPVALAGTEHTIAVQADVGNAIEGLIARCEKAHEDHARSAAERSQVTREALAGSMMPKELAHIEVLNALLAELPHDAIVTS